MRKPADKKGVGSVFFADKKGDSPLFSRVQDLLVQSLRQGDAETREQLDAHADPRLDVKVAVVFVTAAVSLTLMEYVGKGRYALVTSANAGQLGQLTYWALSCVTVYFVLPAIVIKLVFRERLADYGFKLRGMFQDAWVYGLMLLFMVPTVVAVSFTGPFQAKYPFYHVASGEALWPRFFVWELLYALQFVALEFFFRGFLVHGTRHRLGFYSIFAMMVPYCMIHFQKPMLETFAAIIAGIVLGMMSLRTRSVILGAMLHISVAWLMDFLALWQRGVFQH